MAKRLLTFLTLLTLFFGVGWARTVTDHLSYKTTGITGSSYSNFSGKTATSDAVYAGQCAGGSGSSIQLRATNPSGVVTTASGGKVRSITVTWNTSSTTPGRQLDVYGKNTPYTATGTTGTNAVPSHQLFDSSTRGTLLGSLVCGNGNSTTITVDGDYEYIGFRSSSNALYLTAVDIVWEDGSTPTAATPTFSPAGGTYYEPLNVTLSSTTEGATIRYTTDGTDPTATTGTVYTGPISVSSTTTIKAIATATGHDPSSVASATYEIFTPNTVTPLYEETFAGTFGYFYKKDVTGTNIWVTNSGYAKASGYISGSATDSEGWLISPYIDLTNAVAPKLSFSHAGNYFNNSTTMHDDVKVMIKKQSDTQWSELTIDTWPDGNSWTFADNTTSLASYAGEIIQIAFVYTSSTSRAGTWEIKNLIVEDTSAPKYYLYGTFNGWNTQDADYEFNLSNGAYSITGVDLPDNVRFKIAKVVDGQVTEYGAANGGGDYGINGEWHTNIPMNGNDAYYIASGALTNITLNTTNMTFDVNRDAQFFVKGDFNGWNREAMTATDAGWTIEQVISSANQFGFVNEWGYWYGGNGYWIKEGDLDNEIEIKSDGNFYMDIAGTDDYMLTVNSAKTTLTVTKIVVVAGDDYVLVTDVDDLDVSSSFIIVSKDYSAAMAGQNNNNRAATSITLTDEGTKTAANAETQVFTLEQGANGWYFNTGSGYLYAASGSNNYLRTKTEKDNNALAAITIDSSTGKASVVFQGTNSHNVMQYNNGSSLFACYASASQSPVYLYKKVEVEERATPPVITPASQNVKGGLLEGVMITAANSATIHYTLDGSEPTTESPVFDGNAFNVTGTGGERKMVRAIAVEDNLAPSYPASVTYTFQAPATPIISPEAGTFETPVNVTISSTDGGTIYYLVDPEESPTNAAAVIDGNQVYTEGETEITLLTNGTHKVYAAVDLNGITSWAQATYTISVTIAPPEFYDNYGYQLHGGETLSEDNPIWIDNYYEEDGIVHYMIDPESVPTAEALNENGTLFDYYSDGIYLTPGQHTIYAVVKVEDYLSDVVSITVNVYEAGDWRLVTGNYELNVDYYEYIIVNSDHTLAAGAYENGSFNGVACENGNVIFDPDFYTAAVNSADVKIFTFEVDENENLYLKDADGNYYSPTATAIGQTSSNPMPVDVYHDYQTQYVSIYDAEEGYGIVYNNNHFEVDPTGQAVSHMLMYFRPRPVTLTELVEKGNTEFDYTISDELVAVKCVEVGNDAYLWCKDQGNASIVKTENPDPENIVDYMKANHFFNGNWDQSNWIALIFKNVSPDDMMAIKGYEGKRISEGTLKGKYISRENYAMQMNTTTLTTLDGASAYSPNVYCAANFLYRNQNGNATGHEPDGTPTDDRYFFVNPKVQEFCDITFAVWHPESDYYDGYFTLPAPDSTNNTANIYGAFMVNWTLNAPCGDVSEYLSANPGEAYRFKAIVHQQIKKSSSDLRENTPVTPQSGVRPEGGYVVYPVGFDPTNEANIVTRIENVAVDGTGKAVAGVKYYNLAGIESDRPFEGVNIIVTTYTDGSRSSSKVLK